MNARDSNLLWKVDRRSRRSGLLRLLVSACLVVFGSLCAYPQSKKSTLTPPSDLGRENMDRVAASTPQIEAILHANPGLMVELKSWIAKDATDHGQLISDSDLTDQAILDRLESDIQFRSIATRLLQSYGYLLPKINPDSQQAKEQELLVQERTKWLAQDQEEELAQGRKQQEGQMQQAGTNAPAGSPASPQQEERLRAPFPAQGTFPPNGPPAGVAAPRPPPTLEQAELMQTSAGIPLGSSQLNFDPGRTGNAGNPETLGSRRITSGSQEPLSSSSTATAGAETLPPIMDNSPLSTIMPPPHFTAFSGESTGAVPSPSQAMIRQPNPFEDIPSLYDMYLQASPQPPVPERFGMEVFQNGTRDLQMIPMDLPVGPDYVVGPGDGLAIDLWGGVSERIVRTVDSEGRLSLPEVGPVLVSGKSLADVQQTVQHTLRSQFRDVSADVSLARLRSIRVYVVGDVAHPGAYDISSLSTPLNAIFAAGGPTARGSLRNLEQYRGKQLVQDVDVYDLLLRGVKTDIERLENGDTVLVPPIGSEVTVEGMVRRPSIYELKGEKSLADVLELAGGLLPTATLRHIEVQRIVRTTNERC